MQWDFIANGGQGYAIRCVYRSQPDGLPMFLTVAEGVLSGTDIIASPYPVNWNVEQTADNSLRYFYPLALPRRCSIGGLALNTHCQDLVAELAARHHSREWGKRCERHKGAYQPELAKHSNGDLTMRFPSLCATRSSSRPSRLMIPPSCGTTQPCSPRGSRVCARRSYWARRGGTGHTRGNLRKYQNMEVNFERWQTCMHGTGTVLVTTRKADINCQ